MRITRSGLRRLIAEESARLLAEMKKGHHEEEESAEEEEGDDYYGDPDPFGDDEALEKGLEYGDGGWESPEGEGEDDYYGDADPFGDDEALEKGYEYGDGGWQKGDDYYGDEDPFGDDEALEKGYEYGDGGWKKPDLKEGKKNPHERVPGGEQYRAAMGWDDDEGEEEEDWDDEGGESDWEPAYDTRSSGFGRHLSAIPGEDDLYEGEHSKKGSPRGRLTAFLKHVGADVGAVMDAVDAAVARANEEGAEVNSEDVTFNLADDVLDAIPEDEADIWHALVDGVLNDEVAPGAYADAEAHRQDIEDTERDLSHPSNFLDEGEGSRARWLEPGDADPDDTQGFIDEPGDIESMDYVRGGGSYSSNPYADVDVPDNAYTRDRRLGRGRVHVSGDDVTSGEPMGRWHGDNLTEDESDALDETEDSNYNADLQARHGQFTTPEEVKGTPQHTQKHAAPRHPASSGGGGYVSRRSEWGDPDLFGGPPRVDEARWAKLAGILKG